jgi:hypothetical protein
VLVDLVEVVLELVMGLQVQELQTLVQVVVADSTAHQVLVEVAGQELLLLAT